MPRLLVPLFPQPLWHLIIDDTLILPSSKKAPGSRLHREHSKRPSRDAEATVKVTTKRSARSKRQFDS